MFWSSISNRFRSPIIVGPRMLKFNNKTDQRIYSVSIGNNNWKRSSRLFDVQNIMIVDFTGLGRQMLRKRHPAKYFSRTAQKCVKIDPHLRSCTGTFIVAVPVFHRPLKLFLHNSASACNMSTLFCMAA